MATHRTRQDVCPSDDCGHVVAYPTRVRHPEHAAGPVSMYGKPFAVVTQSAEPDPGQNVPHETLDIDAGQNVPHEANQPRTLIPAPSYSRDEYELAAGPHYWGDAPPEESPPSEPKPLPVAPSSHIARAFRRLTPLPAVSGGSE
jgi:hypothetical protein